MLACRLDCKPACHPACIPTCVGVGLGWLLANDVGCLCSCLRASMLAHHCVGVFALHALASMHVRASALMRVCAR
eukprot:8450714-Alexandrium_andersonii.AAC.1